MSSPQALPHPDPRLATVMVVLAGAMVIGSIALTPPRAARGVAGTLSMRLR